MRTRPAWLDRKIDFTKMHETQQLLRGLDLNTVCNHARCPNITECYARRTATFLILGAHCTRNCRFCAVSPGTPELPDKTEPARLAQAVARLAVRHVVVTSVTRDDLADGGAAHYAAVVAAIRAGDSSVKVELLIPDFGGAYDSLRTVLDSSPDVLGHNVETVPSLYHIRAGASYARSIELLSRAKAGGAARVKSGIMLGLGESEGEIRATLRDIRDAGADYLSIGQYLQPSKSNIAVNEYIAPAKFAEYGDYARTLGFMHVESAPYVRSSYHADRFD